MYTINITMTTNQLLSGIILHVFLGDLCRVFRPYAQKCKKSSPKPGGLTIKHGGFS
jgi:hypothetical protein